MTVQVGSSKLIPGGADIYDDIIKTLEDDGELDDKTFRRLVLFALVDLGRGRKDIKVIKEKVEELEENSLYLIAKKHPKISLGLLGFLVVFVISVIAHLELWGWLAELAGIPLP